MPKKASPTNNLKVSNPKLAKEWHPTKNGDLKPTDITPKNHIKVWWLCKEGHEWVSSPHNRNDIRRKTSSTCPTCKSLEVLAPLLMNEWNFEKNKDLNPSQISLHSGKYAWWKCNNGHEWKTIIANRTKKDKPSGCPLCSSQTSYNELFIYSELKTIFKTVVNRKKTLKIEIDIYLKELKIGICYDGSYWHKSRYKKDKKNTELLEKAGFDVIRIREKPLKELGKNCLMVDIKKDPIDIVCSTLKIILTTGKVNVKHNKIIQQYLKEKKQRNKKYFNQLLSFLPGPLPDKTLTVVHPKIAAEWDYKNNLSLQPSNFSPGSNRKVWWICEQIHSYEATIAKRTGEGTGCPYCAGQSVGYGNDLKSLFPEIANQWHPTKNKNIKPTQFTKSSGKIFWWICENGHQWKMAISMRTRGRGCPICKSLEFEYPRISKYWNNKKNNLKPSEIRAGSEKTVWWECENRHEFEMRIKQFVSNPECPHCKQKRIGYGYDFSTQNPELLKEWDYKKNKKAPESYFPNSNKYVWWLCSKNHSYQAPITRRVSGGSTCPYCSGHKIGFGNDFESLFPEVAKLWHTKKNKNIKPNQFGPSSHKKAWWLCENGHEWEAVITSRSKGVGCPYCSNKKAGYGNDLESFFPDISKIWHPSNNGSLKPSQLTPGSSKRIYLLCNNGHERTILVKRFTKFPDCPRCKKIK